MPFGIKKPLQVDLGEMHEEKDKLTSFLNTKLKTTFTYAQNHLTTDSEAIPPEELERAVNKFVYHQNLNRIYFVSLDGQTVKVNKFKNAKKPEKKDKKPGTSPTFAHGF
jgi:hypothetical protein